MKLFSIVFIVALFFATGQEKSSPPALTTEQKQELIIASQAVDIFTKEAQIASMNAQHARDVLAKRIAELTPAGYTLDNEMKFIKLPEKSK